MNNTIKSKDDWTVKKKLKKGIIKNKKRSQIKKIINNKSEHDGTFNTNK